MSDTPRTDAFSRDWDWYNFHDEALTFAKKLERELEYTKFLAQERLEDAQKARREVAELRELLTDARLALRRVYNASGQPSGMRPLLDKFDAALNPPHAQGGVSE